MQDSLTCVGSFISGTSRARSGSKKGSPLATALALDPQLPEGLAARAGVFWVKGKYDKAIQYARRAIERKPDCEGAYWFLGQAYFASDRWQEAAAAAPRAIEVSGDDYNVYIPYINALERLGQTEAARDLRQQEAWALERHLAWVPEDVRARILLANDYAYFGKAQAVGFIKLDWAARDPDLACLHDEPEFQRLLVEGQRKG